MKNLIILFLICCTGFSYSQETLTARDAVLLGLKNNYQIQIAEKQVEISEKNNTWSEAGLFPTVTLNATFSNTIQDNRNNPLSFIQGRILSQNFNPVVNANWNIFTGLGIKITKERLELLEKQSNGNFMLEVENTAHDILKAYYTILLQEKRLELFQNLLNFSSQRVSYYELKAEYGQANSLEILQFKNQYLTDSTNLIQQEVALINAKRNLLILMNEEITDQNETTFPILADSLSVNLEMLEQENVIANLKSNNQNLKNQYINLELQNKMVSLQKSFLYPVVSLQAGISPAWGKVRDLDNNMLNSNTQQLSYFANINLRYNLFNNYKTKRASEVAKIQAEIMNLSTKDLERKLTQNTVNLFNIYKVQNKLVNLSVQNIDYAIRAFNLAEDRFEQGAINSLDLQSFRNNYLSTALSHYDNLYNRLDVYFQLYKASGKMQLTYSNQ